MRRILITAIFIVALFSISVMAADAGRESVFSVGVGARPVAMGGGFSSLSHDGSSVYYNPAGLSRLGAQELSVMYLNLFEGSEFHFGSWVHPIGDNFGFGIGYMRVGTNDIIKTQNFVPLGEFSFSQSQFLFALGYNTADMISIGGTIKIVNQELDNSSDYSVAADAGVLLMLPKRVRVGFVARDFIPASFKLEDKSEKLTTSIAAGIGIEQVPISDRVDFTGSVEIEKSENRNEKVHTGGEILIDDAYAIRAGYDKDNLSMGVGYTVSGFSIDYAYKVLDQIDNSHFFSLSYKIGEKYKEPEGMAESSSESTIEQTYSRQFTFYKSKADNFYDEADFDSALVYYYKALAFYPDDKDVKSAIEFIDNSRRETVSPESSAGPIDRSVADRRLYQIYLTQSKNFYDNKFYQPALELIEQLLELAPKHEEAKRLKEKIEKDQKAAVESRMKEARSAEQSEQLAQAVEAYTRVLELEPSNSEARQSRDRLIRKIGISEKLYLGISQFQQQKFSQAKTQFETVLKYDSTNTVARDFLNKINQMTAIPTPLEEIQEDKEIWPFYLEGLRLMREKQYQQAIDAWHKVLAKYPNSSHTINNIQQARLRLEAEK